MLRTGRAARDRRRHTISSKHSSHFLASLGLYLALFAWLTLPWLRHIASSIPRASNLNDAQLIVWILAWCAHALATDPLRLFDANINYPALGQLTGSDHLLSSQLVFAPLFWSTGNAILATNLLVLISYPLAALAMERLVLRLGCGAVVAWVAGLVFALGALRVRLNIQLVQYLNLYLPLVAYCLVRLRADPRPRWAVALLFAFAAGIFSSYYMALMLSLVAVVWGTVELVLDRGGPARPSRVRFVVLALVAGLAAGGALALFARPYFAHGATEIPRATQLLPPLESIATDYVGKLRQKPADCVLAGFGLLGALALLGRSAAARRAAAPGLVLAIVGTILSFGYPAWLAPWISVSPLRFQRAQYRFEVVASFGNALLLAAGLELIRRVAGRLGFAAALLAGLLVLGSRGLVLVRSRAFVVPAIAEHAATYQLVGRVTRAVGPGPLLELPLSTTRKVDAGGSYTPKNLEIDAMLGSTLHWLPLLDGYTGYHPPHRKLFLALAAALPRAVALEDLVDMTHLRWVLLRPEGDWQSAEERADFLEQLVTYPHAGPVWEFGGFTLVHLDRHPSHPEWFAAASSGRQPDRSVLGTPVEPIPAEAAVAVVQAKRPPTTAVAGMPVRLLLSATNAGTHGWPVALAPRHALQLNMNFGRPPRRLSVVLAGRWTPVDEGSAPAEAGSGAGEAFDLPLRRDVPPGESIAQIVEPYAPQRPGTYDLEIGVKQINGARFRSAGNQPLRLRINVEPARAGGAPSADSPASSASP